MSDTIYRAMGYRWKTTDHPDHAAYRWWSNPRDSSANVLRECTAEDMARVPYNTPRDPLTDWSAFGEILEWAEKAGWRFLMRQFDDWGVSVIAPSGMADSKRYASSPDFRTAVLAALESAIGGTE